MNDFQPEPHDDLADDADLLRSLQPRNPQLNWQAIVAELPDENKSSVIAQVSLPQPSFLRNLATSWWSGALAGSLITLAVVTWSGSTNTASVVRTTEANLIATQVSPSQSSEDTQTLSVDAAHASVAQSGQATANATLDESLQESMSGDPTKTYMLRHGIGTRMVSRSMTAFIPRSSGIEGPESDSEPLTQSALRKLLLDFK